MSEAPSSVQATHTGVQRIADAFAGHGRAGALMPYVMGGYPDLQTSLEIGQACAAANMGG